LPHRRFEIQKRKKGTANSYSIDGVIVVHRVRSIASIFTAEVMAVLTYLSQLTQFPPNSKHLLLTDSLSALHLLTDPYKSNPLIQRILLTLSTLYSINSNITFIWVPSHIGFSKHDKADSAAKQATTFPTITDESLIPVSGYKNHLPYTHSETVEYILEQPTSQ